MSVKNMSTVHDYKPVSADSHIAEPPECFGERVDKKFRDRAPHLIRKEDGSEIMIVEGFAGGLKMGRFTAAGMTPQDMANETGTFADVAPGGYEPNARLIAQDRDGIAAEMLYPTVGMLISGIGDADLKHACAWAYNGWLQEFCSVAPSRLYGIGQTAVRSVDEAIQDFHKIRDLGFKGVMMPPSPATEEDYDHAIFDPLWRTAVELQLPISFHSLTSSRDTQALGGKNVRGPKINGFQAIVRTCQDIIGMFVFGGVFDRVPDLKLVSVEADAGWAPHFMYRADHAYKRHRFWLTCPNLEQLPSWYIRNNVFMTFQDDWTAFQFADLINPLRLMWANDYPHADSTWPDSQQLLAEHASILTPESRRRILRDNVVELYSLQVQ